LYWKNGSHSEIEVLRCDKLPPLKGILPRYSRNLGMRSLRSEDKNWYDRKELIKEIIETTLYESMVLDNQGWIIDQGMIGSKFYSNQTHKQTNTSCLQHWGDAVKSKASSLSSMKVFNCRWRWCNLSFLHVSLLIMRPKSFGIRQPNRIGRLRVGLKAIRVLNKRKQSYKQS
jgi:hypothetical protein